MFRIDDEYVDTYARLCGMNATAVYMSLCRHVNGSQESFPSVRLLMDQHGFGSHNTVRKAIKVLESFGIISVKRERDPKTKRQMVNVYTLMDVASWKKPVSPNDTRADVILDTDPVSFGDKKPVSPNDTEGSTEEKVTHGRNVAPDKSGTTDSLETEPKGEKPMVLDQFVEWCGKSPHAHVRIIGEWAETTSPDFQTVGQWEAYIKRNVRAARTLTPFSHDQLSDGFVKIKTAIAKGWLTTYTLETLFKFITNVEAK